MTKLNITRQIWPKSNRRTKRSAKREITPYTQANGKRSYRPFVPKTNTHLVICRTRLMKIEPENLRTNEKINKKVNFLSKVALERPRISKSLLNWSKNVHRHKYSAEKERKNCAWVISINAKFFFHDDTKMPIKTYRKIRGAGSTSWKNLRMTRRKFSHEETRANASQQYSLFSCLSLE